MALKTTKKGSKWYVCAAVQNADLDQTAFEALTWVEVKNTGQPPELSPTSNIVSYDTVDEDVTQKQKGVANAGDPTAEVASNYADPGQIILRTFSNPLNNDNMAVKREWADMPSGGSTNSIFYSRGVVSGPEIPTGRSDDFDTEIFTLGLNQLPIRVDAT